MRSWKASGRNGYWVIEEKDPHGTGVVGSPLFVSNSGKSAREMAAALNDAYQSGRDHATKDMLDDGDE